MHYIPNEIEQKWQKIWKDTQTFKTQELNQTNKPKYYVLDMFPYPSGAGLHVGHPLGYIASDIVARYKRHQGFNVLHPMGYDSFGLPAEQYAIQTGQHPAITTETNINRYREQLDKIGFSFDWSREVRTSNADYYKWTQWIFIQLFNSWYCKETQQARPIDELIEAFEQEGNININAETSQTELFGFDQWNSFTEKEKSDILLNYRLTYLAEAEVNWCPELGTVLANDEVINGVSERGGFLVIRKKMTQWMMRITAYAERLLKGLETIDWSDSIKDAQRNWIGKSKGASINFPLSPKRGNTPKKPFGYMTGGSNSHILIDKAKEMRENPTNAEEILWENLKSKKIGFKFRQQHLIGDFIVDFVCLSKKLVIEIDGGYHDNEEQKVLDEERTSSLNLLDFEVIRFKNEEVLNDLDGVLSKITNKLNTIVSPLGDRGITVFTTRPDTIFGVTYLTLAPEHPLVLEITTDEYRQQVLEYIETTAKRSERERMAEVKTITGTFTGAYAIHPFSDELIPIWIGDYVLASYGTGAVMAVPAGDERDFAFAKHFNLPIKNIFNLPPTPSQRGGGTLVDENSEKYPKNEYGFLTANPKLAKDLVKFAKENRKNPTQAENLLWNELRNKKIDANKFRQQHYIGNFIVDFVCLNKMLVIEVDGDIHDLQQEYDEQRTLILEECGFKIIRFKNEEILYSISSVIQKIKDELKNRKEYNKELESQNTNSPSLGGGWGEVKEAYTSKENISYINSEFLDGLDYQKATEKIIAEIEENDFGRGKVNYRLRDAVFSRQRYWGEPIPIYYKNGVPQAIPTECLPLELPEVEKYLPTEEGEPPLGRAEIWAWNESENKVVSNDLIDEKTVFPLELNTMPGWAGSSWYFNRYMDSANENEAFSKQANDYWQQVDLYLGGSEHATGHLLYSRFWQKFLFDLGYVSHPEYAKKLINQGMILGNSAFLNRLLVKIRFPEKDQNNASKFTSYKVEEKLLNTIVVCDKIKSYFITTKNEDLIYTEKRNKLISLILPYIDDLFSDEKYKNYEFHFFPFRLFWNHVDISLIDESNNSIKIDKFFNDNRYEEFKNAKFITESGQVLSFGEDLGEEKFYISREVEKMSKSKYNVVNPDEICDEFGADTLRMYEMFLGPLEQSKPWNTQGISGVFGFLKKFWRLYHNNETFNISDENPTAEEFKILHQTIKKVTEDIENFSFNTSVSTFMIATNELTKLKCNKRQILEPLCILISPYAPHIAEELWSKFGNEESISYVEYPKFDEKYLVENTKEYPISFNGKMRFTYSLPLDLTKEQVQEIILNNEKTIEQLQGKSIKNFIYVPGKIINLVS